MNASGPDDEKRDAPRQRTLKGAKIVFKAGAFTFDCVVRNLSATGAQLAVSSTEGIPNAFELVFDDRSTPHKCTVMWRSANRLGVVFEEAEQG